MTGREFEGLLRTVTVDLSQDSVLPADDGSSRVVLSHIIDQSGSLTIVIAAGGEVRSRRVEDVLAEASAQLRLTNPNVAPDNNTELLNWLPEEKRREGLERERHVLDVRYGTAQANTGKAGPGPYDPLTTTETQRRAAKIAELGVTKDKFGHWFRKQPKGGALALVSHATRALQKSGAAHVTSPEILAMVRQYARDRHLSSKKDLINEHALVLAELRRQGLVSRSKGTPGPGGTTIPFETDALPYDAFQRLIRFLDRGRNPRSAKTRQQQSNRPPASRLRHRGFDFADRVEIDSTPTDILVWGPDGPRRLWAVFAVCVSTRYCWLRLVPEPPRGIHLALLLWDMVGGRALATGAEGDSYESIPTIPNAIDANIWIGTGPPPATLPGCIVLDHGAEEENGYFISICAQLGIQLHWARTMEPTDKAFVESKIRQFASFCQLLPGHKGNTVENRPHRTDANLLTFEQAQAAFRAWPTWAANQPNSGLAHDLAPRRHLTPMEAISLSLTRGVPLRVLADPTFHLRLMRYLSLVPQDDGVTWEKRRYTCPGFEDVVAASASRGRGRAPLTFYYDPDSPGRLYWPEPDTFQVRTLHAPGVASRVSSAFTEVRQAMLKHLTGQTWPSHNELARRRADLVELLTDHWQQDGLDPAAEVVPITGARPRRTGRRKAKADACEVLDNRGWDLSAFTVVAEEYAGDFADALAGSDGEWPEDTPPGPGEC